MEPLSAESYVLPTPDEPGTQLSLWSSLSQRERNMTARLIGLAAALALALPQVAQAGQLAMGTVATSSNAYVARDGRVVPATIGMQLRLGDRVVTRANGSANVALPAGCTVPLGASTMLPVSGSSCANSNVVGFDEGRAGYAGKSSAFSDSNHGWWIAGGLLLFGGLLYLLLHDSGHHHHHPVSP
jgi:hypothetical protein